MEKRIITWQWGGSECTTSRGFIFGGYNESFTAYKRLVDEAKTDFPLLTDDNIGLSKVRQSTYMDKFICVSFPLPPNTQHEGYGAWDHFDFHY